MFSFSTHSSKVTQEKQKNNSKYKSEQEKKKINSSREGSKVSTSILHFLGYSGAGHVGLSSQHAHSQLTTIRGNSESPISLWTARRKAAGGHLRKHANSALKGPDPSRKRDLVIVRRSPAGSPASMFDSLLGDKRLWQWYACMNVRCVCF